MEDNLLTLQKMNPEIKAQWVTALRSGEYEQGTGHLCRVHSGVKKYCCLGVLATLAPAVIINEQANDLGEVSYRFRLASDPSDLGGVHLPTESLNKWAGLNDDYHVRYDGKITTLYSLNDKGVSFETIADLIEEQL